ncbi:hypothetical protein AAG570_001252 [Ranatra chinensis]|uniref:Reverse transcriptase domain-containing protein n=1 Tax=Ranatra chinensis TaxID=642074 RepID=A0ABD0YXS1_9HEMI
MQSDNGFKEATNIKKKELEALKRLRDPEMVILPADKENTSVFRLDPSPPRLCGLPKVHKPGVPLRPIVSAIGSVTHETARLLARELRPLIESTTTYIKNSMPRKERLKSVDFIGSDHLVSFEVTSLFTNIPIKDTVDLVKKRLPVDLARIAELCLNLTFFLYRQRRFFTYAQGNAGCSFPPRMLPA